MARPRDRFIALLAALLLVPACRQAETGPIAVSAIGAPPRLVNPNREALDAASAFLVDSAAQGLVRFDSAGQIEPALAQRWIASDDGLRYTFRLARAQWRNGDRITAEQVVSRLRAATSGASRNPVKPLLGAIDEIVAMTDDVLEISLKGSRPNFLQLLAQPELALIRNGEGSGPYAATRQPDGSLLLAPPARDDEAEAEPIPAQDWPPIVLRGERAEIAVARFDQELADLVLGGRLGDLPTALAAEPGNALLFDPAAGLFGLAFVRSEGPLARTDVRQALSMALDRAAIAAALRVPGLQPRETLLPAGIEGLTRPAAPAWTASPLPLRREAAAEAIAAAGRDEPVRVTVELPDGPGFRLLFAHLRRDWAMIGVTAQRARPGQAADLRLVDEVAPVSLASWYLRRFTCEANPVCDPAADEMLAAARIAPTPANRRGLLATADRILAEAAPFIPIATPVRWSLVSPRLTGFRPNPFAHHAAGELIRRAP
jgi:peptide/nickel transport system substrate-binding protein